MWGGGGGGRACVVVKIPTSWFPISIGGEVPLSGGLLTWGGGGGARLKGGWQHGVPATGHCSAQSQGPPPAVPNVSQQQFAQRIDFP